MWTSDRDGELRRLGPEAFLGKHPGTDAREVRDRYLLLLDLEGRAALLREKNRAAESKAVKKRRRWKAHQGTEDRR